MNEARKYIYDEVYRLVKEGKISQTNAKKLLTELLLRVYEVQRLDLD